MLLLSLFVISAILWIVMLSYSNDCYMFTVHLSMMAALIVITFLLISGVIYA